MLRKILLASCLIVVILLSACRDDIQTKDTDLKNIVWQNRSERYIIVNYWAKWCGSCRKEIPALNAFYKAHLNHDALLLSVHFDPESLGQLKKDKLALAIMYPVLMKDPKKRLGIGDIAGIPANFIFNKHGALLKSLYGIQSQKSLEDALLKLDRGDIS